MPLIRLANETDFEGWRTAARSLLTQGIAPEVVKWRVSGKNPGLFDVPAFMPTQKLDPKLSVSRDFFLLCKTAILYRDPARFDLLYRILWRISKEPHLFKITLDPDVVKAKSMAEAVRSDLHNMKTSVRFKSVHIQENDKLWSGFVAWFEPSHFIVQASASFFTERFTNMRWSILTPDISMHWNGKMLSYSPYERKEEEPKPDAEDKIWRAYQRSISNQGGLNVSAMKSQIPKNQWRNLPEAERIPEGFDNVDKRKSTMSAAQSIKPQRKIAKYTVIKEVDGIAKLDAIGAKAALHRLNIEMLTNTEFKLAEYSTQAVLGAGAAPSDIMLLGEQPGEQEDVAGQLFIGPIGKVLDQALQDAGIERSHVYTTNSLKHFKFKLQGMRRMQIMPSVDDIKIYLPWLQGEINIVQPRIIVALGPIAAHAITGKTLDIEVSRGKLYPMSDSLQVLVTYHPMYILRTTANATKLLKYERFLADLNWGVKVVTSTTNK